MKLIVPFLIAANWRRTFCQISGERTIENVVNRWKRTFTVQHIPEPEGSAVNIMASIINTSQLTDVYQKKDLVLSIDQEQKFSELCEMRLKRVPVQYIIKEWSFRDLTLKMKMPVFIPRPETESLIDLICLCLNLEDETTNRKLNILDVCCGSGAIGLSLKFMEPQFNVTAIDRSLAACELTRENAILNNLKITVENGNLTSEGILQCLTADLSKYGMFDVIVSNPPYIKTEDMAKFEPELKLYEDPAAFDGGVDGLNIIIGLMLFAGYKLPVNGKLFMEIDCNQTAMIAEWVDTNEEKTGLVLQNVIQDYNKRDRFVYLIKEKEACNNAMNCTKAQES